ncbi:unnamed protein product [Staurois parvus]|uniref:Uncharacterized protein n=1 Tax=Staurois parvus TaxID=386267 RepID=A0ABN9B164_9NEOB|nr:unnamed protein product [Staurois parvus]
MLPEQYLSSAWHFRNT